MMATASKILRRLELPLVALALLAWYFVFHSQYDFLGAVKESMFLHPDAQSYQAVGDWIFGLGDTDRTFVRPFLFPLVLNLTRSFGNVYGVWLYQLGLWVGSGLLIYSTVKRSTTSILVALVTVAVYATNITLMNLPLHGLTEVTIIFLLSLWAYMIIRKPKPTRSWYWILLVFLASILTVIKPIYLLLLLGTLLYSLPFLIREFRSKRLSPLWIACLILALSPIFVQLTIMKVKHDKLTISEIGYRTANRYYFSKVYGKVNDLPILDARKEVQNYGWSDMGRFLMDRPERSIRMFVWIIRNNNLRSGSDFVDFPTKHPELDEKQIGMNRRNYRVHMMMLWLVPVVVVGLVVTKQWPQVERVALLAIPLLLIILSSGLTFWQGDRIVLPSLPLWLNLYALVLALGWQLARSILARRKAPS